jgi:type 1 glutamine amidotransferase
MIGGSFDYHPQFQLLTLELVEPDHPLTAAFDGKGYVHYDEPYFFTNAYEEMNFRPLLKLNLSKLDPETLKKKPVDETFRYVSWIKRHGEGRVFYCSPSHHPGSYETEAMLRYVLDGVQYALGDLKCDDSPLIK